MTNDIKSYWWMIKWKMIKLSFWKFQNRVRRKATHSHLPSLAGFQSGGYHQSGLEGSTVLRVERERVISSVQSLSRVQFFATPWIAAHQASLSITNSQSSLRLSEGFKGIEVFGPQWCMALNDIAKLKSIRSDSVLMVPHFKINLLNSF